MSVSDDLEAIANYIEQVGWIQGTFGDSSYGVCTIGAMNRALNWELDRIDRARKVTCDYIGTPFLAQWNDQDGRTANQVVETLRDAATKNRPDEMRNGGSSN